MDELGKAICFATAAFNGKVRKCEGHPAILHSLEAAAITQSVTDEPEAVIAAVLHDIVEDTDTSLEELRKLFGSRVAELVASETEDKQPNVDPRDSWRSRKLASLKLLRDTGDMGIKALYLGDKLSNMRSLYRAKTKLGDGMWNMFHQKDPQAHYWYYRTIADYLKEYSHTTSYQEYMELIHKTFER